MEYRLVQMQEGDTYAQIFDESKSELIGSVIRDQHFGIFRYYQIRLNGKVRDLRHRIINPRSWTIDEYHIGFRWKLLGDKVTVGMYNGDDIFATTNVADKKLVLTNKQGRTGLEIDPFSLKSSDMVLVTTYDRIELYAVMAVSVLSCDRYELW